MHALKWLRPNIVASRRCQSLNIHIPEKRKENTSSNKNLLPFNYIMQATSNKHLLTHFPASCNFWLKIPQDKLDAVTEVMNYVMHGIILYDDVEDGTHYRRNLPAAHRVYGTPLSLNSAIFCILEAFNKVLSWENPKALNMFCDNFLKFVRGTAQDIYWRDNFLSPMEDEYKAMSADKSGCYFVMTNSLMQSFSQDQRDYRELLITLGLYYQIRDEYTNLVKVEALEETSRHQEFKDLHNLMQCEDITEGRFSWAMIHALKTSEGPTIRSILVQRTTDIKIKQHCLSLLEKVGSLDYTRQTLQHLDTKLRDQIRHLGGNPALISFLDELYNWKNH